MIVYVDGLNLYYSALKRTPYKWLDLKAVFQKILAGCSFFRSTVGSDSGDFSPQA